MSLQKILLQYKPEPENILPVLKEIQKKSDFAGRGNCEKIAEYFSVPLARIFEVASFFDDIKTEKSVKKVFKVCSGGPCGSQNAAKIARQLEMILKIEMENDAHPKYKLEYMSCLGLCDRGPIVEIDGNIFEKVKPETVDDIILNYL